LCFSLKYRELEACFDDYEVEDLVLQVLQTIWHHNPWTPAEYLLPEGDYHLLIVSFNPEAPNIPLSRATLESRKERTLVYARVFAVPREALMPGSVWRETLRTALTGALHRLARPNLWASRWQLEFVGRGTERLVEVKMEWWTGLRPEETQRWSVPVPRPDTEGGR
jgi:hypothetical protein